MPICEQKKRGYFDLVKQQIEDMYVQSDNTKVTIVAHSMGAPTTLFFLNPENGIVTPDFGGWAG